MNDLNDKQSPANGHKKNNESEKSWCQLSKDNIRRHRSSKSDDSSADQQSPSKHNKTERRQRRRSGNDSSGDGRTSSRQKGSQHRSSAHNSRRRSRERKHKRSHSSRDRLRHKHRSRSRSKDRSRRRRRSRSRSSGRSSRRHRPRSPRSRGGLAGVEAHSKKDTNQVSTVRENRSRSRSPYFRSGGFDRAMDAQERLARRLERAKELMRRKGESKKQKEEDKSMENKTPDERVQEAVRRAAELLANNTAPMSAASQESLTVQISAQVAALQAKALADTGIAVPSYYNPLAVNPISYAQQAAKRKKLWAKKEGETNKPETSVSTADSKTALWSGVKFGDDKSNEKFHKLMGIKTDKIDESSSKEANEIIKKQAEVFQKLDMQYQQARITTHTQRGLGLGFSSSMIDPYAQLPPTSTVPQPDPS